MHLAKPCCVMAKKVPTRWWAPGNEPVTILGEQDK